MFPDFLQADVETAARRLLGCRLVRNLDGERIIVQIVETEAYDQLDPASHSFHGRSERNRAMFGPAGHAYVYLIYGVNLCMNVTAGDEGFGAGVLIRAVEPVEGTAIIEQRYGGRKIRQCLNGPGKLTRALGIGMDLYGHDLRRSPLQLETGELRGEERVEASARIGVTHAKDVERRFTIAGNPYCSR